MTRRVDGRLGRPPLPPGVKNERFSAYVPEAVLAGLDSLAAEQRTTRTNLVRTLLTAYVAARYPLPEGMCIEAGARRGMSPTDIAGGDPPLEEMRR